MNAIIGMTSVLAERDLGPTERHYVDVIAESGEKLLVIIDDLLDLSSLEAGKFTPVKSVFDIRSLVENAVDTARALPQAGKLSIVADIDCAAPAALLADAVQIRQIVLNLLTNAVKYAGRGVVTIRVSTTRTDNAAIMLRCEVEDTGPGIPEELRARLFRPFERGQADVENRVAGTGLGLTICRRLVDMMGGSIGVESAVGVGSRFWFEVPCREGNEADPSSSKTLRPQFRPSAGEGYASSWRKTCRQMNRRRRDAGVARSRRANCRRRRSRRGGAARTRFRCHSHGYSDARDERVGAIWAIRLGMDATHNSNHRFDRLCV